MKKKNNSDRGFRCSAKRIAPFLGGVFLCMPTSALNHEVGRVVQEKQSLSSDDENTLVLFDVVECENEDDKYNPSDCNMSCGYSCQGSCHATCQGSCNSTCAGGCTRACKASCQLSSSGEVKQTKTDSQEPSQNTVKEKPTKKSKKKKKK